MSRSRGMFRSIDVSLMNLCLSLTKKDDYSNRCSRGLGPNLQEVVGQGEKLFLSRNVNGLEFESYQCDITSYSSIKAVTKKIKNSISCLCID